MPNTRYSCQSLVNSETSRQIFKKYMNIKFHENPSSGRRVVPCRRTDRRTNTMKLIVSFRNFAKAPKTNVENFSV